MFWPSRKIFVARSASAHAVQLLVALEIGVVRLEVRHSLPVGEVVEELGLGWVDARDQGCFAGIADRARRQAGVLSRVPWSIHLQLRVGWLGRQPTEAVQESRIHSELQAPSHAVAADAADITAVRGAMRLAPQHRKT